MALNVGKVGTVFGPLLLVVIPRSVKVIARSGVYINVLSVVGVSEVIGGFCPADAGGVGSVTNGLGSGAGEVGAGVGGAGFGNGELGSDVGVVFSVLLLTMRVVVDGGVDSVVVRTTEIVVEIIVV